MKIAILGASGVIGTWLTEKLLKDNLQPRIVVRQSPGIRLARHSNLDLVKADFNNFLSVNKALESCDVVVNCIVDKDTRQTDKQIVKTNITIAKNIAQACINNKISRIIHLSSVAVLPPCLTQKVISNPYVYSKEKDWYTRAKIESEKVFLDFSRHLQTCILRPAIVYGPLLPWSILALSRTKNSIIYLPDENPSLCHAVHVDDLSRLIYKLLLVEKSQLPSLVYGVNSEKITWSQFYEKHAEMAGFNAMINKLPMETIKHYLAQSDQNIFVKRLVSWLIFSPFTTSLSKLKFLVRIGQKLKEKFQLKAPAEMIVPNQISGKEILWPSKFELKLYNSSGCFYLKHNGESLGFKYKTDFKKGCQNVAQWWNFELDNISEELNDLRMISKIIK